MRIRPAESSDQEAVWSIIQQVIASGDTYVFHPQTPKEKMLAYWFGADKYTYVAEDEGQIVGTFLFKDNQPDLGSHIANASYMTAPEARGKGVGMAMGNYSLEEARKKGYKAMQFNIVVKTNEQAVRLWQKVGFQIIGEIPEAYQHQTLGLVNAYIMYQAL